MRPAQGRKKRNVVVYAFGMTATWCQAFGTTFTQRSLTLADEFSLKGTALHWLKSGFTGGASKRTHPFVILCF